MSVSDLKTTCHAETACAILAYIDNNKGEKARSEQLEAFHSLAAEQNLPRVPDASRQIRRHNGSTLTKLVGKMLSLNTLHRKGNRDVLFRDGSMMLKPAFLEKIGYSAIQKAERSSADTETGEETRGMSEDPLRNSSTPLEVSTLTSGQKRVSPYSDSSELGELTDSDESEQASLTENESDHELSLDPVTSGRSTEPQSKTCINPRDNPRCQGAGGTHYRKDLMTGESICGSCYHIRDSVLCGNPSNNPRCRGHCQRGRKDPSTGLAVCSSCYEHLRKVKGLTRRQAKKPKIEPTPPAANVGNAPTCPTPALQLSPSSTLGGIASNDTHTYVELSSPSPISRISPSNEHHQRNNARSNALRIPLNNMGLGNVQVIEGIYISYAYVSDEMDWIYRRIYLAVDDLFLELAVDVQMRAEYIEHPDRHLGHLYEKLFNVQTWQEALPGNFSAFQLTLGLIGVSILEGVFEAEWAWQLRMPDGLLKKYIEEHGKSSGSDVSRYWNKITWTQANDERFHAGALALHATSLAVRCAETLFPHISSLTTSDLDGPRLKDWVDYLQEIFQRALVLKCKLDAVDESHHYIWYNPGEVLNRWKMQELHKAKGTDHEVIFTVFPGLERESSFNLVKEPAATKARVLV